MSGRPPTCRPLSPVLGRRGRWPPRRGAATSTGAAGGWAHQANPVAVRAHRPRQVRVGGADDRRGALVVQQQRRSRRPGGHAEPDPGTDRRTHRTPPPGTAGRRLRASPDLSGKERCTVRSTVARCWGWADIVPRWSVLRDGGPAARSPTVARRVPRVTCSSVRVRPAPLCGRCITPGHRRVSCRRGPAPPPSPVVPARPRHPAAISTLSHPRQFRHAASCATHRRHDDVAAPPGSCVRTVRTVRTPTDGCGTCGRAPSATIQVVPTDVAVARD